MQQRYTGRAEVLVIAPGLHCEPVPGEVYDTPEGFAHADFAPVQERSARRDADVSGDVEKEN